MARGKRRERQSRLALMFRPNEWWGLLLQFLGATSISIGLYWAVWFAVRPLYYRDLTYAIRGAEWLVLPLLFGLGGLLWVGGRIELRDALPSHRATPVLEAESFLRAQGDRASILSFRHLLQGVVLGMLAGVVVGGLVL